MSAPHRAVPREYAIFEELTRAPFCRCGHSGNKPFCDGTHREVGFQG